MGLSVDRHSKNQINIANMVTHWILKFISIAHAKQSSSLLCTEFAFHNVSFT